MSKTYPEVLGDWVKQGEASRPDRNLVAFLAVREEAKAAVEAGYSIKAIWKNMRSDGRIVASYDTFRRYMNRHLRPVAESTLAVPLSTPASRVGPKPNQAAARSTCTDSISKTRSSDAIPSFTFNSKHNLEDLI
jgi:hypothetical protein